MDSSGSSDDVPVRPPPPRRALGSGEDDAAAAIAASPLTASLSLFDVLNMGTGDGNAPSPSSDGDDEEEAEGPGDLPPPPMSRSPRHSPMQRARKAFVGPASFTSEREIDVPPTRVSSPPPSSPPPSSPPPSSRPDTGSNESGGVGPEEFDPGEVTEIRSLLPTLRGLRDGRYFDAFPTASKAPSPRPGGGGGNDNNNGGNNSQRGTFTGAPGGGGEEAEVVRLSKDIYSILFAARPCGHAFAFALGVFTFQILILILILADTIEISSETNPLRIPGGVSVEVRTAQFLAILVAVATQDDVITSINTLHHGYPGRCLHRERGATRWQWIMSVGCRFMEGALCLVATFALIVQSSEVVELFLDFLAVTFVSTLDNIAFNLVRDGYFSRNLKREARDVARVRFSKSRSPSGRRLHCRPLIFFAVSALMILGWGIIVRKQNLGDYTPCRTVAVQFGDDFAPTMAHFSGVYAMRESYQIGRRAVYVEMGPEGGGAGGLYGRAAFAYCEEEKSWTFSTVPPGSGGGLNICLWHAKSPETDAYDITEIPTSEWLVLGSESQGAVPFVHFSLLCNDCNGNGERGLCSGAGRCRDNQCVCNPGRYGQQCEFEEPCPHLEVDTSKERFPAETSHSYDILLRRDNATKARAYGRPVYVGKNNSGTRNVIVYTGRRWILTSPYAFGNRTGPDLADFLSTEFHGNWSDYRALYVSGPMDRNTPTDSLTPVGLAWYRSKSYNNDADRNRPLQTLLICALCDDVKNPCGNGGKCVNGTCQCNYGTFGNLCQVSDFILCRSVAVQFGDDVSPMLGAFSGVYDLLTDRTVSGRSVYVERRLGRSMFAYCDDEKAWTMSALSPDINVTGNVTGLDPCSDWIASSSSTETYDVTSLKKDWLVRRSRQADEGVPLLYFNLRCDDCAPEDSRSCSGDAGRCAGNGCVCRDGRYGLNCELYKPCERLEIDTSKPGFPGIASSNFTMLRRGGDGNGTGIEIYERPVYVDEVAGGTYHIIAFIGRRWVVSKSQSHALLRNVTTTAEVLADYLENTFHGYLSDYAVDYISEPADVNTLVDTASPVDLSWYGTKAFDNKQADQNRPAETLLLCSTCNDIDYVCNNGGACDGGECSCPFGTFGAQCQVHSVCGSVSAQFGPELGPDLSAYSGAYDMVNVTLGDRPVYVLRGDGGGGGGGGPVPGGAAFAYCVAERSWTFTAGRIGGGGEVGLEPCGDWAAKSSASHTYDVVSLTSWLVRDGDGTDELVPLPYFTLSCSPEEL